MRNYQRRVFWWAWFAVTGAVTSYLGALLATYWLLPVGITLFATGLVFTFWNAAHAPREVNHASQTVPQNLPHPEASNG